MENKKKTSTRNERRQGLQLATVDEQQPMGQITTSCTVDDLDPISAVTENVVKDLYPEILMKGRGTRKNRTVFIYGPLRT